MTAIPMTPEELTERLDELGLDARLENHAGGPGSPDLPTVDLPDGTVVVIGNYCDGTEVNGEPMQGRLHAQRHARRDPDGFPEWGEMTEAFDGTQDEVVARLVTWHEYAKN